MRQKQIQKRNLALRSSLSQLVYKIAALNIFMKPALNILVRLQVDFFFFCYIVRVPNNAATVLLHCKDSSVDFTESLSVAF